MIARFVLIVLAALAAACNTPAPTPTPEPTPGPEPVSAFTDLGEAADYLQTRSELWTSKALRFVELHETVQGEGDCATMLANTYNQMDALEAEFLSTPAGEDFSKRFVDTRPTKPGPSLAVHANKYGVEPLGTYYNKGIAYFDSAIKVCE